MWWGCGWRGDGWVGLGMRLGKVDGGYVLVFITIIMYAYDI